MINIEEAKLKFDGYLNGYDRNDDKIHLKITHTYCVLDAADEICREEGICGEDHRLALLIALLHDIGRFEQLKQFNSFQDSLFDHAGFGVKVLFEDGMIRQFIQDCRYDEIIKKAIGFHSVFSLDDAGDLSERELLHCRIIRDADKLDNFRVKETERLETIFDAPAAQVVTEEISPWIMECVRNKRCVLAKDRVTHMDFWVSYLAFIFDLNFQSSFRWIIRRDYMNRNIDRMRYQNPKTRKDMEEIRRICNQFIQEKAK